MVAKEDYRQKVVRARHVVESLGDALVRGESCLGTIPGLMLACIEEGLWKERQVMGGKIVKHERFIDFITTKPVDGLGEKPETIKKLLRDDPAALAAFEAACVGKVGRPINGDIRTGLESERGTTKAYTLRRLAKDHPKLFERVKAGELSANAAAIEAGFRKKDTPFEVAVKAYRKLSKSERSAFLKAIAT